MRNRVANEKEHVVPARDREKPTGALTRGLAIIETLLKSLRPLSIAEISSNTSLDHSTALRLLRTLEENGQVLRVGSGRKYTPSPGCMRPLPLMHPIEQLRRDAAPTVSMLASNVNQTVVMVLFVGNERMVVDIAQRPGSLSPYYETWLHGPVHATGAGKSLLLGLDSSIRRTLLGPEPFAKLTPHTITGFDKLEADLAQSVLRGYVVSAGEHREGLTAIGSNINSWLGNALGCLVVTGHSGDLQGGRRAEVGEEVKRAAKLILFQSSASNAVAEFCNHQT